MLCTVCQRENRADARFCDACGATLPPSCAACGRALRADARFCDGCGRAVDGAAAPVESEPGEVTASGAQRDPRSYTPRHLIERILGQRSALEGERRHVTVLFADLADSTPLVERTDPEAIHALMDRCFQLILDQVHGYEGTVNQFTGDGVMALFGAPLAWEDAPRRAVLAALAIQRVLAPLDQEVQAAHGARFLMRIGIHSGPVVIGRIGDDLRMDYTAVGDTTNLAARLQTLATPGSIWISEATRQLVAGFFELRDLGLQQVKGKREAVRAFEVLAERPVSGRIEAAAETGLTPLVGREAELVSLRTAFDSACEGRGRVVFVVGDAGIGKSRLLYEFRHRLADEPHHWIEGHCSAYAATAAFHPIGDALRRLVGIDDRDDESHAAARLDRYVAEGGPGLEWTLPLLRGLLALPADDAAVDAMDPIQRRSQAFRALQAVLLRASQSAPLVFVVEDLHWIDPASQELLGFLSDSIPAARALLLFTSRPGQQHSFGDRSYHVRIAPQALSREAMRAMAGALLRNASLPSELLERIAEKAEGNPFFVEEVTKSLLEEGVLRLRDGRVELARVLDDVTVPDSIQDVLMARLDRLAEEPRRAIQVASVIGREFALRLLAQIREAGDRVQDVVGELRALELIYEKAAHPELAFMFKHALTHDVAYESILRSRRKRLHRVVGAAIEELYRDRLSEHYAPLAHHFEKSEDWERALEYRERAATQAAEEYANRSVIEHSRRALAICDRLGGTVAAQRRARLEEMLAVAHQCLSEFASAGEAFLRAAEACTVPVARARALAKGAHSLVWAHEYERALEASEQALRLARTCEDAVAEAIARGARELHDYVTRGPMGRADHGAETAVIAERSGHPLARGLALSNRAVYLSHQGEFSAAIECGERALQVYRDAPGRTSLALSRIATEWSLAIALASTGEYARALALLQDALGLSERCGDRIMKARALNTLGWCFAELGDHRRAQVYDRQAEQLGAEMTRLDFVASAPEVYANSAINLANDYTALGDLESAQRCLEPVRTDLDRSSDPWAKWRYSLHLQDADARIALAAGDPEGALAHLEAELGAARTQRARKIEARALCLRGRACLWMDERDFAEEALRAARDTAAQIRYPPAVWRADSLLAELARRRGDTAAAERLAAAARRRVGDLSRSLPDADLAARFRALGDALVSEPLTAYR